MFPSGMLFIGLSNDGAHKTFKSKPKMKELFVFYNLLVFFIVENKTYKKSTKKYRVNNQFHIWI